MKKILFSLVLLLGISDAQVCSEDPFCRPAFEKGRFNTYGQDYILSVPRQFVSYMMEFSGENEWIKIKRNDPNRHQVDPSQYYFDSVDLNYRWDNLEPWDGRNDIYRTKEIHLATKIVQMRVDSRGRKSIPRMTEEEYRIALDEERRFRHNTLSKYIHDLTLYIDWSREENKNLTDKLKEIGLEETQYVKTLMEKSRENVLTSEQFRKISTYQEDSRLYHFPYTHISPDGRTTNKTDYYWFIDDTGIVTDYIICTFNIREEAPPMCKLMTAIPEKRLLIKITFSGWHLKEWQQIKANSLQLLENLITKAEEE